jgi:hypothetical protein
MNDSSALDKYDLEKAQKALKMLLIDRSNEFRELANGIGHTTDTHDWEWSILNFSIDFVECFKTLSDDTPPEEQIHKCVIQMRQIARGKSNMTEVMHFQNIAYLITEDFKSIYKRME